MLPTNLNRLLAVLITVTILPGCGELDTGVGTTAEGDYTLTLQVTDRFLQVGDEAHVFLRLGRTDRSNLDQGFSGTIVLAGTGHLQLGGGSVSFSVADEATSEFLTHVPFTVVRPGVAEVRASFSDASAAAEVLISEGDLE